jgi:predicted dehydrogenase
MASHIRIGITGIHGYGATYFSTLLNNPNARITAICDINEGLARLTAEKFGVKAVFTDFNELLSKGDVDAIFIATPHFLHHEMTMAALEAGKHVLCEKPLAITAKDAYEMAEKAHAKGLLLGCHYNRRQSVHVKLLKDLLNKGKIGEVYAMNLKWMARYTGFMFSPESGWRIDKNKAGGGIMIGRGSHMLDAALYLLDYPEIIAVNANVNSKLSGFDVEDYAFVTLRLANGAAVTVECAYVANIPHYAEKIEYEVFGTKLGAYCLQQDKLTQVHLGHGLYPNDGWVDLSEEYTPSDYESVYPVSIVEDFVQAVIEKRPPLVTASQAALITDILETAYRSSAEQRELKLAGGLGGKILFK